MKDLPPKQVFGPTTVGTTLERITDWLARFQAAAGEACADEPPIDRGRLLDEPLARYERWFRPGDDERSLIRGCAEALPDPGAAGFPRCRAHGDFSPANVLWNRGRLGVIDFEYALEPGLPLEDLFHFLASMRSSTSREDRDRERHALFEEVFYSAGPLAQAARKAILALARRTGVALSLLEPLFVLAWMRIAVRTVELRIGELGLEALRDDPDALWSRLDRETEEFLPVARVSRGVCRNVRQHLEMRDRFALAKR